MRNTNMIQGHRAGMDVLTIQQRIAKTAGEKPAESFTSLNHYMDLNWMKEAYHRLRNVQRPRSGWHHRCRVWEEPGGQPPRSHRPGEIRSVCGPASKARPHLLRAAPRRSPLRGSLRLATSSLGSKGDGKETRPIGVPTVEDSRA
jgi:hypothetical protein